MIVDSCDKRYLTVNYPIVQPTTVTCHLSTNLISMNLKSTLLLLLCLMMAGMVAAKDNTKVIAHRGYWKTEGSAQNSIRSLERASEIGAYGSEFDVHLTADNVLVIFHDNDIQGKHIQSCTYVN